MYSSQWYKNLIKPEFVPPDGIFAPVWTILYVLIFVSLIQYILSDKNEKLAGYVYFTIQMLLNLIWSPIFFFFQKISLALGVVILLDIFVFLTMKKFYSASKIAGYLLIPYFLWILFATYLIWAYRILN